MNNNNRSSELNTIVKVALLLGFAAFYIVSLLTGSVHLYVHPRMIPFMIFAAVVMIAIAAVYFFKYINPGVKNSGIRPLLLFIAALLMAWAFPAQTFNADTGTAGAPQLTAVGGISEADISESSGAPTPADADDFTSADGSTPGPANVPDSAAPEGILVFDDQNYYENLYNIYQDLDAFVGRDVQLTGFVFKDDAALQSDEFVASRLLMVCCAADMQTVGLLCRWPSAVQLEPDAWVKVSGTLDTVEVDGDTIPVIEVISVETAAAPDVEYIYPF